MDSAIEKARDAARRITANVEHVVRGQSRAVKYLLAAFAAGGHVLLEDVPGTGKTTLAKTFALSIDADFKRIQFTPDLLPSDILGVTVWDQGGQSFRFMRGPVFTHILLADEINRASPRTQAALLESMGEGQVSSEGEVIRLQEPFFVLATQNPLDFHGTYPLPESQMDRFSLRFSLGYVEPEEEAAILEAQTQGHPIDNVRPCVTLAEALDLRKAVKEVRLSPEMARYIVDLVAATRGAPGVKLGAGPRASLTLMNCSRALALLDGFDFVTPDHVRELATSVVAHRLMMDQQALYSGTAAEEAVESALASVKAPV